MKVYINNKGKRQLVEVEVIKENAKTVWVKLRDGNVIKRHKER